MLSKIVEAENRNNNNFMHHAPSIENGAKMTQIRVRCLELANHLINVCPASREQSLAITKLEEVMFWANASIVRNP